MPGLLDTGDATGMFWGQGGSQDEMFAAPLEVGEGLFEAITG